MTKQIRVTAEAALIPTLRWCTRCGRVRSSLCLGRTLALEALFIEGKFPSFPLGLDSWALRSLHSKRRLTLSSEKFDVGHLRMDRVLG